MALDVHIVADPDDDRWLECEFGFEDADHEAVFRLVEGTEFPLLNRASDFYADAQYFGLELIHLVREIDLLLPRLAHDRTRQRVVTRFRAACLDAFSQGRWLYLLCD